MRDEGTHALGLKTEAAVGSCMRFLRQYLYCCTSNASKLRNITYTVAVDEGNIRIASPDDKQVLAVC